MNPQPFLAFIKRMNGLDHETGAHNHKKLKKKQRIAQKPYAEKGSFSSNDSPFETNLSKPMINENLKFDPLVTVGLPKRMNSLDHENGPYRIPILLI